MTRHTPSSLAEFHPLEERRLMAATTFTVTDLVSDTGVGGSRTDANLVNGWGLAPAPSGGPWWVASAGKGLSLAFNGTGDQVSVNVTIPPTAGGTTSSPTGVVMNPGAGFVVSKGGASAPSEYVFVTEDGTVNGWSSAVDPANAIQKVDNSASGAVYKGAAIATRRHHAMLYVADFHNARIDVFDSAFAQAPHRRHAFRDAALPAGYAPFNVANVNGFLYVSYALQDSAAHDDVGGPRHGFVDVFDTAGTLVKRFASRGSLDSPWAMVTAPADFGTFAGDLLVGNFGNGKVSAFNHRGRFMGFLSDANSQPLEIPGLWGLAFGNGATAGPTGTMFFAAGPNDENDGLFGSVTADQPTTTTGGGTGGTGGIYTMM